MSPELTKEWKKIKDVWGVEAFERIEKYYYTLYRKIEDLQKSREKWKEKFFELQRENDELKKELVK